MAEWTQPHIGFEYSKFKIYELRFSKYSESELSIAQLLSLMDEFYIEILTIRKNLGINIINDELIEYFLVTNKTPRSPHVLAEHIVGSLDNSEKLMLSCSDLARSYRLPSKWIKPLMILVCCDFLVLPFEPNAVINFEGIRSVQIFETGDHKLKKEFTLDEKNEIVIKINLTERMSPTNLAEIIKKDEDIKLALTSLPVKAKTRVKPESDVMYWGYKVWVYDKDIESVKDAGFKKVYDYLDGRLNEEVPMPIELAGHFKRFVGYLDSLKQK